MKLNKTVICLVSVLLFAAANAADEDVASNASDELPNEDEIIPPSEEESSNVGEDPPKVDDLTDTTEAIDKDNDKIPEDQGEEGLPDAGEDPPKSDDLEPDNEVPPQVDIEIPPKDEDGDDSYTNEEPHIVEDPAPDTTIVPPSSNNNSTSSRPNRPSEHEDGHGTNQRPRCRKRYGFMKIEGHCDSYVECRNYRPRRKLCPDGMNFNEKARWSEYPCGYPADVPCQGRTIQRKNPTRECPHQFGFFPVVSEDKQEKCSQYVMCSAGEHHVMKCPLSLVFNPVLGRCDWPQQVPDCKDYIEFKCPHEEENNYDDMIMVDDSDFRTVNYKHASKCSYFWSCLQGHARMLRCDYGMYFDSQHGRCVVDELGKCNDYDDAPTTNEVYDE